MQNEANRPTSVWLTQGILLIGILLSSIVILASLFLCVSKNEIQQCLSLPRVSFFATSFCTLVFLVVAFHGLQKRKLYGKWLGAIFLVVGIITGIVESHYFQIVYRSIAQGEPLPAPPYECWQTSLSNVEQSYCGYSSYIDLALRATLDILFPQVLFGLIAIHLVSSRAAKRFFKQG